MFLLWSIVFSNLVSSSQERSNHSPHLGVVHHRDLIGSFVCVNFLKHSHIDRHISVHLPWLVCKRSIRLILAETNLDTYILRLSVSCVKGVSI